MDIKLFFKVSLYLFGAKHFLKIKNTLHEKEFELE